MADDRPDTPEGAHEDAALEAALAARPEGPLPAERLTFAEIRHPRQRAFLVAYATCAVITRAAQAAGVGRRTVYDWRHAEGPEGDRFQRAFDEAYEIAGDVLEMQAHRLAVEGIEEPLVSAGKIVGTKRVFSEKVLLALLAARRPKTFGAKLEVDTGPGLAEAIREGRARALALAAGGRPPAPLAIEPEAPRGGEPERAPGADAAEPGADLRPATPRSPRPYPSARR